MLCCVWKKFAGYSNRLLRQSDNVLICSCPDITHTFRMWCDGIPRDFEVIHKTRRPDSWLAPRCLNRTCCWFQAADLLLFKCTTSATDKWTWQRQTQTDIKKTLSFTTAPAAVHCYVSLHLCECVCRYEACCPDLKRPSESPVTQA